MDTWDCFLAELDKDLQPSRLLSQPFIRPVKLEEKRSVKARRSGRK